MESLQSQAGPAPIDLQMRERLLFAVPLAAALIALIAFGGLPFTVAVAVIAAMAVAELLRLVEVESAVVAAGAVAVVGVVAAADAGGAEALIPAVLLALLALFAIVGAKVERRRRAAAIAFGTLGVVWVGAALAHGVLLRDLPHGGALVTAALLATFIGDSAAHLVGARYGRHPLAPAISPRKTVEGLLAGIVVGTGAVLIFALGWHDWLQVHEALAFGLVAALAAPAGDLCESMLKRSVGVKDSGALLGPHGGVLDRVDAVLFTVVAAYYVALLVV